MKTVRHQVPDESVTILPVLPESEESVRIPLLRVGAFAVSLPIDMVVAGALRPRVAMVIVAITVLILVRLRGYEWIVAVAVPFTDLVVAPVITVLAHDQRPDLAGLQDLC